MGMLTFSNHLYCMKSTNLREVGFEKQICTGYLILPLNSLNEDWQLGGSGKEYPLIFIHLWYKACNNHDCDKLLFNILVHTWKVVSKTLFLVHLPQKYICTCQNYKFSKLLCSEKGKVFILFLCCIGKINIWRLKCPLNDI